jgi:hypothetical protein
VPDAVAAVVVVAFVLSEVASLLLPSKEDFSSSSGIAKPAGSTTFEKRAQQEETEAGRKPEIGRRVVKEYIEVLLNA